MIYLKIIVCNGIYKFISLHKYDFDFIEIDDNEYRVELSSSYIHSFTLFEKKYITSIDRIMKRIANLPDGAVIDVNDIFDE